METIQEFLFKNLEQISLEFPTALIRYGYDRLGGSHLIDANPKRLLNEGLGDALWDLELRAAKRYPYELVTTISENSELVLEQVEREWAGAAFEKAA